MKDYSRTLETESSRRSPEARNNEPYNDIHSAEYRLIVASSESKGGIVLDMANDPVSFTREKVYLSNLSNPIKIVVPYSFVQISWGIYTLTNFIRNTSSFTYRCSASVISTAHLDITLQRGTEAPITGSKGNITDRLLCGWTRVACAIWYHHKKYFGVLYSKLGKWIT